MTMRTHEFLIDRDDPEKYLQVMADLREHVDAMPNTAALWRPGDATDGWPHRVADGMITMLGAWEAPDWRTGSSSGVQFVNPRYVHAKEYSGLRFSCGCGRTEYGYGTGDQMETGAIKAHEEDCPESTQRGAKLKLYLHRVAWLKRAAFHWVRQPIARKRLGFTDDHSASRLVQGLAEGYHDWYGRGKEIAANTMTILRGLGVDAQLIADAYGTQRHTVYSYKRECDRSVVRQRCPEALEDGRRKSATVSQD